MNRTGSDSLSSSGACDANLKQEFMKTYYPLLSTTCNQCHVTGGPGNGQFADASTDLAYSQFMAKGYVKIDQVATAAHYFPASKIPTNTATISGFSGEWLASYGDYMSCLSAGSPSGPSAPGSPTFKPLSTVQRSAMTLVPATPPVPPAAIAIGTPYGAATGAGAYQTLTWDLEADAMAPNLGLYKATASIQVRPYYLKASATTGTLTGFQFTNPRLALKTGNTTEFYTVTGLHVGIDGVVPSDMTTFNLVSGVVNATGPLALAATSTSSIEYFTANVNNKFDLRFDNFAIYTGAPLPPGPPAPPPPLPPAGVKITYAVLSGTGAQAIFTNSCVGCHNPGNLKGNFNISTYATALVDADLILNRMQSVVNPMPPGGLLPLLQVDLVQQWINNGKPQN